MTREGALTPQVRILIEVDQLDRAIHRILMEREDIRQQVRNARAEVEALQQALTDLEAERKSLIIAQRTREGELKQTETRLARTSSFSHVTSEKELEAAQREVQALRERVGELEELILEGLERLDALNRDIPVTQARLEQLRRSAADLNATLRARFDVLGEELEVHRRDRIGRIPDLEPELRATYERLIQRYKDRAVTTVTNGLCPPCQLQVPAQHVVDVLMGKAFHTCQHCGRLVLPEGELE